MTKIKTFDFMIHSSIGGAIRDTSWNRDKQSRQGYLEEHHSKSDALYLWSPEEIDKKINTFIKDKKVCDIKVKIYTSHQHNNGRDNTIISNYTIIYETEN